MTSPLRITFDVACPAEGIEHDWGVVTVWDPPKRLAYLWHLGRNRDEATAELTHDARNNQIRSIREQGNGIPG